MSRAVMTLFRTSFPSGAGKRARAFWPCLLRLCRTWRRAAMPAPRVERAPQARAPARLLEGSWPTEALLAEIAVSKRSEHMPLNRQADVMARHGVPIDRTVLADWLGRTGSEIAPVVDDMADADRRALQGRRQNSGLRSRTSPGSSTGPLPPAGGRVFHLADSASQARLTQV